MPRLEAYQACIFLADELNAIPNEVDSMRLPPEEVVLHAGGYECVRGLTSSLRPMVSRSTNGHHDSLTMPPLQETAVNLAIRLSSGTIQPRWAGMHLRAYKTVSEVYPANPFLECYRTSSQVKYLEF